MGMNGSEWGAGKEGIESCDVSFKSSFRDFLFESLCLLRLLNRPHPRTLEES